MPLYKTFGPFNYRRTENGALSVWPIRWSHLPIGFLFGPPDDVIRHPNICIRFFGITWFSIELFEGGIEIWFLGFWYSN